MFDSGSDGTAVWEVQIGRDSFYVEGLVGDTYFEIMERAEDAWT